MIKKYTMVLVAGILGAVSLGSSAAQASSTTDNISATSTIRIAETALASYHTANDTWTKSRFTLAKALNTGSERAADWVVSGGKNVVHSSGRRNNPNKVFIYDLVPGRFGAVTFCVGSRGTMNYCTVMFGNAPTQRFSLARRKGMSNGVNNTPGAYGYGVLRKGSYSRAASFSKPQGPAKWLSGLLMSVPSFTG